MGLNKNHVCLCPVAFLLYDHQSGLGLSLPLVMPMSKVPRWRSLVLCYYILQRDEYLLHTTALNSSPRWRVVHAVVRTCPSGLKRHSVTLFEGGRVGGAAVMDELITELAASAQAGALFEGDMVQVRHRHAYVEACSRGQPVCTQAGTLQSQSLYTFPTCYVAHLHCFLRLRNRCYALSAAVVPLSVTYAAGPFFFCTCSSCVA